MNSETPVTQLLVCPNSFNCLEFKEDKIPVFIDYEYLKLNVEKDLQQSIDLKKVGQHLALTNFLGRFEIHVFLHKHSNTKREKARFADCPEIKVNVVPPIFASDGSRRVQSLPAILASDLVGYGCTASMVGLLGGNAEYARGLSLLRSQFGVKTVALGASESVSGAVKRATTDGFIDLTMISEVYCPELVAH
jgi:hypothetical protein